DHRLGANEAPPAIISILLGDQVFQIQENIENGIITKATSSEIIDLGISSLPIVSKDNSDRNRTSPFAFTGNKFEFRAVGSSQSISFPAAVLNTIVAESLDYLAEKIKAKTGNTNQIVFEVLKEELKEIKPILFNGDNYTAEWELEAEKRGLPNYKTTPIALKALVTEKALNLFEKHQVLSQVELKSRYLIYLEKYIKDLEIEVKCLNSICLSQIIPAAAMYQKTLAGAINETKAALDNSAVPSAEVEILKKVVDLINKIYAVNKDIAAKVEKADAIHDEQDKAEMLCSEVKTVMNELRDYVDELEVLVDDDMWPMPKFWEMLFIS
ncbi:MAG: glutamine synthetase type III, partial [Smithella sp.]